MEKANLGARLLGEARPRYTAFRYAAGLRARELSVTVFVVVGVVGLLLLLTSLLLGDLLEGVADVFDFDGGAYLSGPAIGGFLAAFGFGAAVIDYNTDWGSGGSALGGVGAGVVMGGVVGLVTRSLMHTPTDESTRAADLLGGRATVVTRIPEQGYGEVSLVHAGHLMKLSARAGASLPEGTDVVITSVVSPTSVVVAPHES